MTGDDLKLAIKADKRTVEEISKLFGITRNTLDLLFKERQIPIKYVELAKEIGLKSMILDASKPVPYYDIDATAGNVSIFNEDKTEYIKQYISVPAFADCDMFINISGNSMYPKYCSGELIAIKKIEDREVISFGEAYLIVTKEQRLLKYIHKGKDKDHWVLKSENTTFDEFDINHTKKVLHVYIVKGKITKNIL